MMAHDVRDTDACQRSFITTKVNSTVGAREPWSRDSAQALRVFLLSPLSPLSSSASLSFVLGYPPTLIPPPRILISHTQQL